MLVVHKQVKSLVMPKKLVNYKVINWWQKLLMKQKRLKEKALTDIEQSKSDAISAVKTEMSDLTVLLAEKIMGANLDKTAQSQLIDSYLDDLGEA